MKNHLRRIQFWTLTWKFRFSVLLKVNSPNQLPLDRADDASRVSQKCWIRSPARILHRAQSRTSCQHHPGIRPKCLLGKCKQSDQVGQTERQWLERPEPLRDGYHLQVPNGIRVEGLRGFKPGYRDRPQARPKINQAPHRLQRRQSKGFFFEFFTPMAVLSNQSIENVWTKLFL